tara:strand:+ start:809 stop:1855 length:1047 start_codon:yes stop_codon:yes gene_type:complete
MTNKCVLPFIGHDYQSASPCCLLQNKNGTAWDDNVSNIEDLLSDHRKGVKSSFCDQCWKTENTGVLSKRQRYNKLYAKYLTQTERLDKVLIIPVGNVCNLYCVTCNPGSSTSWIKKQISFGQQTQPGSDPIITEIETSDMEKIKEALHVEFIGGETLKSFSLWNHLSNLDKATSFSLQTNGTVELNEKQVELLKSFKDFNICFSLDGHGKIFEYIRQPAKWDHVQKNVQKYLEYFGKDKLSIFITVSNLNIFYIDEIVMALFKMLPCKIELNLVEYPSELSYNNLPMEIGAQVEKRNPGFFKNKNIDWVGTNLSMQKLIKNLDDQDRFSGLDREESLQELFDLIKTPD